MLRCLGRVCPKGWKVARVFVPSGRHPWQHEARVFVQAGTPRAAGRRGPARLHVGSDAAVRRLEADALEEGVQPPAGQRRGLEPAVTRTQHNSNINS